MSSICSQPSARRYGSVIARHDWRSRGLPVTKRRVEYIRDKISGRAGGGGGGGGQNDGRKKARPRATTAGESEDNASPVTSESSPPPPSETAMPVAKRVTRGAIHGGRGSGGGSAGLGQAQKATTARGRDGEEDGQEEAGADFLAELRDRFTLDTDELASDTELELMAEDALFASPSSGGNDGVTAATSAVVDIATTAEEAGPEDGASATKIAGEVESSGSASSVEEDVVTGLEEESPAKSERSEWDGGQGSPGEGRGASSEGAVNGGGRDAAMKGEEEEASSTIAAHGILQGQDLVLFLEEIKSMKVGS